ncbi:beta-lactamase-like protein [Echria macrotheca]|uniref:Beta-lactamase-like protein n=1 Tax=Echria macrotheca TaxID=438768 RepID=A0AAJ0FCX2_9PEZI|nr:beta-lactamase-like protein [Echria macrotheca]
MTSSPLSIPPGATARVSIIDSTARISNVEITYFLSGPPIPGFTHLGTVPAWSFLIESPTTNQKILFDLAVPPDYQTSFSPALASRIQSMSWTVTADKHISQILTSNGVSPSEINAIIWSHSHFDHIGDPSTFPPSTDLVVGPGFAKDFLPAYPTNPDSALHERYFAGRKVVEIDFDGASSSLRIGGFRAFDFFGDGSFYLLDTPGHMQGHMSGLARTSVNPDTFIMMGGDLVHHGGELRPSPLLKIPREVRLMGGGCCCPGEVFERIKVEGGGGKADEPFFGPAMGFDIAEARETIRKAQGFDADENVWFVFAHDPTILGAVDLFPATANGWKEKGWREKVLWKFLEDFRGVLGEE